MTGTSSRARASVRNRTKKGWISQRAHCVVPNPPLSPPPTHPSQQIGRDDGGEDTNVHLRLHEEAVHRRREHEERAAVEVNATSMRYTGTTMKDIVFYSSI